MDDFSIVPAGSAGSDLGTGLAADYGSLGLWFYTNNDWERLSPSDPQYMVGFDGGIAVDFGGGGGLYVYDGTSWQRIGASPDNTGNRMVAYNSGLAVDYGSLGLYFWQNGDWVGLASSDAEYLAVFEGKLAADFGAGLGLWVYDGSWENLGSSTDSTGNRMVGID